MKKLNSWQKNYPTYWSRMSRKYGLDSYCLGHIQHMLSYHPLKVFELGIGNGFPFAESLSQAGVEVSGCDISEELIKELKINLPEVKAYKGGYEDFNVLNQLPPFLINNFDIVYCLRTTWYFPKIESAIDFMLKVTKQNGIVIFDIMNADSIWNKRQTLKKKYLFH